MSTVTPQNYIHLAIRTESVLPESKTLPAGTWRLLHAALGMVTELAELMGSNAFTSASHGMSADENQIEEVGDVFWYLAIAYDELGDLENELSFIDDFNAYWSQPRGMGLHDAIIAASEFVDVLKRMIFYGKAGEQQRACVHLRMVLLRLMDHCQSLGIDPRHAMAANIRKLTARFPTKFDADHAVQRDLNAERSALRAEVPQ